MWVLLQLVAIVTSINFGSIEHATTSLSHDLDDSPDIYPIALGESVPMPRGYYDLCSRSVGACSRVPGTLPSTRGGAVVLTPALAAQVFAVDRRVNRAIRPVSDRAAFGVRDRWNIGGSKGDCEDYALTKQRDLIRLGWPSSALLIALARTAGGEQHAVLLVVTDHGGIVLDNLHRTPRDWRSTPYHWEKVQSPDDPWTWKAIHVQLDTGKTKYFRGIHLG